MLQEGKDVAGEQPGFKAELLQTAEVVHADRVTIALVARPQAEFCLGFALPLFSCICAHAEHLSINGAIQNKAGADHLGTIGIDCRRRHSGRHIENARPLPQGVVVVVYIFIGRPALCGEALH